VSRRRVCIVGSGTTYLSGISYYTYFLARALARDNEVSVILMRRLVPRVLYPGRERVGLQLTNVSTSDFAPTFNGIDWTLFPSVPRAVRFLQSQRPELIVLQWWSVSSLLAYLVLARVARRSGARVILELHEDLDPSEASVPILGHTRSTPGSPHFWSC
jgi:Glycosyl transferase 4-like domain